MERHLRRRRTSPTRTRCELCDPDGSAPTMHSNRYLYHGACTAMEELEQHQRLDADAPPTPPPAGSYRLQRLPHQVRPGDAPRHGRRQAGRVHHAALHLPARGRLGIGFQMFNDPAAMGTPADLPDAPPATSATPSTGSTSTPPTPRTSTPASTRCAPPASTRTCRSRAEPAYEWLGWNPDTNTADLHARRRRIRSRSTRTTTSPGTTSRPRTTARPTATSASARSTAATCSTTGCKAAIAGGAKSTRAVAASRRWPRPARHRPARPRRCSPTCCGCIDSQPVTDSAPAAAVGQAAGLAAAPAPSARRPPPARKVYAARRRDPDPGRLVAAAGRRPSSSRASAPTCTPRWSTTSPIDESPSGGQRRHGPTGVAGAGAQGLVVPVRLVGLRRQGPARGARRAGAGRARPQRTAAAATSAPAGTLC